MPPAVVFRRGEATFGLSQFEGREALRAMRADLPASDIIEAKVDVEEALGERGELPLVVLSLEEIDEARIDEINADSEFMPAEAEAENS